MERKIRAGVCDGGGKQNLQVGPMWDAGEAVQFYNVDWFAGALSWMQLWWRLWCCSWPGAGETLGGGCAEAALLPVSNYWKLLWRLWLKL